MRQLTFIKSRTLAWWDVPEPVLQSPREALIRPFIAARCDGDAFFLRHDFTRAMRVGAALHVIDDDFKNARTDVFQGPFPYGHECVAEVVKVGEDVRDHAVHDVVILPWSVSCGACGRCAHGLTSHCEQRNTQLAAYGFGAAIGGYGGMVSDLVRVPYADAMLVPVPKTVDPLAVASASDNMPDGYRAVAPQLAARPGAPVLVVGGAAKSIGLYAAGIAVALGSARVDYLDTNRERLEMAQQLGANPIEVKASAAWFRNGQPPLAEGYPISVDASGTTRGLQFALAALAKGGVCTACAFYLRQGTPLPLWKMYMKSATLHVGVSHPRAHLPALLSLIERGAFDPRRVKPLLGSWDSADRILLESATKVIVQRERSAVSPARVGASQAQ
jgi:alcohol dehydrogenase